MFVEDIPYAPVFLWEENNENHLDRLIWTAML